MTFRKFHITPNNSEAFYRNSSIGTENLCVGVLGERGREREGKRQSDREREKEREESNLSLMSLGFHAIILNWRWYKGQYIILIVFRMM